MPIQSFPPSRERKIGGEETAVMKIIEAMKRIKLLHEKAADLREKVGRYCADMDFETPTYENQKAQVDEWIQSHSDTLREIARLRVCLSGTNLRTIVAIELGGVQVTKSLTEWIQRRKDLSKLDLELWSKLGDRNIKEQAKFEQSSGVVKEIRIRRYYDPKQRDAKMALYKQEPSVIDSSLEVVNAVTDLVE
jgi:hypothetical protein